MIFVSIFIVLNFHSKIDRYAKKIKLINKKLYAVCCKNYVWAFRIGNKFMKSATELVRNSVFAKNQKYLIY